jgi:hypothetical protein
MRKIAIIFLSVIVLLTCASCSNGRDANGIDIEDYRDAIIEKIAAPLGIYRSDVQIIEIEKSPNNNRWLVRYNLINCSFLSEAGKQVSNCNVFVTYVKEYDTVFLEWIRY